MIIRPLLYIVGLINLLLAAAMLLPLAVSYIYGEGDSRVFGISILITVVTGALLFFAFGKRDLDISHRAGFVVVAFSWISVSMFSALPFYISGVFPSFTDAFFESVSGLTTTGASVLKDVEVLSHAMLFWRSMLHLIGGMGIVLLGLAILPFLGIGGMQLYKAETSSVSAEKFAPRVSEMARIIVGIYLTVSAALFLILFFSGMDVFDAFIHMAGTVSTGGFSNKNLSVGYFQNPFMEWTIILFMVAGATNFGLHYRVLSEGPRVYLKNDEFRFFMLVIFIAILLVGLNLLATVYNDPAEALRYAAFNVVSVITTTGFATGDFAQWPALSQMVLFFLMLFGGSAGSTAGAIKCIRLLLLIKVGYKEALRLIHPHAVTPVKLAGRVVPPEIIKAVAGFTALYLLVFLASSIALTAFDMDFITAMSSSATMLGNVGPALGAMGPMSNFSMVPLAGKWVFILDMLLGRLEIYTLLILLLPAFWKG
ncbi:MAG: TrkH family potassium uptake protein [Deltaproteobacteria bacterium]|nr:TrkH family potassium uptake protein [Deltaproteobacteria bacterium]